MLPVERLDAILARAESLQDEMNGELPPERFVELSKEYAELDPIVTAVRAYRAALNERTDLTQLSEGEDSDMAELAGLELAEVEEKLPAMEAALELLLLPKDSADDLNVIVEVRAGTGGDEAALFAGSLFRMRVNMTWWFLPVNRSVWACWRWHYKILVWRRAVGSAGKSPSRPAMCMARRGLVTFQPMRLKSNLARAVWR